MGKGLLEGEELIESQASLADDRPERPAVQFGVIGNYHLGKAGKGR